MPSEIAELLYVPNKDMHMQFSCVKTSLAVRGHLGQQREQNCSMGNVHSFADVGGTTANAPAGTT